MTSENAQPEQPEEEVQVVPVVLAAQPDGMVTLMVGPLPLERLKEVAEFITSDGFQETAEAGVAAALEELRAAEIAAKARMN